MSGPPKDYVDVAERIRQFKAEFPEGTLQSHPEHPPKMVSAGDKAFIVYCAVAYRNPSDERPGVGWAWEPVPGPTPFTRDSELMNAETSAWGRAIVALGFDTKHVASSNEVQNRQTFVPPQSSGEKPSTPVDDSPEAPPPATEKPMTQGQRAQLATTLKLLTSAFPEHPGEGRTWADVAKEHAGKPSSEMSMAEANELNDWLEGQFLEAQQAATVPFG